MTSTPRDRPAPTPAERLRKLAARVRRLAVAGRTDPEAVLIAKHDIARALARLARELEAGL